MKLVMAKRGGGMGMGGRGGGMQFGKIGLKLDRMNLHALADRQNEEVVEEVGWISVSEGTLTYLLQEDKQAGSFGSFGKKAPPPKPASKPMSDIRNEVDDGATEADSHKEDGEKRPEEEESMMKVMGFGSFSSTHKSNSTGHEKSAKLRMEEESKRRAMRLVFPFKVIINSHFAQVRCGHDVQECRRLRPAEEHGSQLEVGGGGQSWSSGEEEQLHCSCW